MQNLIFIAKIASFSLTQVIHCRNIVHNDDKEFITTPVIKYKYNKFLTTVQHGLFYFIKFKIDE